MAASASSKRPGLCDDKSKAMQLLSETARNDPGQAQPHTEEPGSARAKLRRNKNTSKLEKAEAGGKLPARANDLAEGSKSGLANPEVDTGRSGFSIDLTGSRDARIPVSTAEGAGPKQAMPATDAGGLGLPVLLASRRDPKLAKPETKSVKAAREKLCADGENAE